MPFVVGHAATVKKSGTSTVFTGEAFTLVSGNTYQITDAAKRVWDRTASFTFYGNSIAIPSSQISSIDYLNGKVTFSSSQTTPITADGKYMPMTSVAGANSFELAINNTILDDTDFDITDNYRSSMYGLSDVSVTLRRFAQATNEFFTALTNGDYLVIEIDPAGTGTSIARGWFVVESSNQSGSVDELETLELSFRLDNTNDVAFSWT